MFCYETKISGIKLLRRISCHMLVVKGLVKVYNMLQMIFNRELSEGGTSNHSLWFCSPTLQTPPPPPPSPYSSISTTFVIVGFVKVYNILQMIFNRELSEDGTCNCSLSFCSPNPLTPPPPPTPFLPC